jgi:hypothetical protein
MTKRHRVKLFEQSEIFVGRSAASLAKVRSKIQYGIGKRKILRIFAVAI